MVQPHQLTGTKNASMQKKVATPESPTKPLSLRACVLEITLSHYLSLSLSYSPSFLYCLSNEADLITSGSDASVVEGYHVTGLAN